MSAELTDRLRRAVTRLEERRDSQPRLHPERIRLNGKIEGVKLAASYLEDEERIFETETSHPETVTTVADLDALRVEVGILQTTLREALAAGEAHKATVERVRALAEDYAQDEREHLDRFGHHHPVAHDAERHLRAALDPS